MEFGTREVFRVFRLFNFLEDILKGILFYIYSLSFTVSYNTLIGSLYTGNGFDIKILTMYRER